MDSLQDLKVESKDTTTKSSEKINIIPENGLKSDEYHESSDLQETQKMIEGLEMTNKSVEEKLEAANEEVAEEIKNECEEIDSKLNLQDSGSLSANKQQAPALV